MRHVPRRHLSGAARTPARGRRPTDGWLEERERSERLRAAERRIALVSRVLDDLVEVPGTGRRFGLDPLIGFVPVIGDAASALVGLWLIAEAARFRLPRIVLARMVLNTLVDLLVGAIPLIGDVFDFVAKPNARNVALFRRYAGDPASGTGDQRAFFAGLALIVAGILWLLLQAVGWLQQIEISVPGL